MDYDPANFNGEKIDKLIIPEGKETEFSLQSYFNLYKLTRVRLYLKTKRKELLSEETKVGESYSEVRNSRLLGFSCFSFNKRRQQLAGMQGFTLK